MGSELFFFETAQVFGAARFIDDFEAGLAVTVEGGAAEIRLEQIMYERQLAAEE